MTPLLLVLALDSVCGNFCWNQSTQRCERCMEETVNLGDPDPVPTPTPPPPPPKTSTPKPTVRFSVGGGAMMLFSDGSDPAPLLRVDGRVPLARLRCGDAALGPQWNCSPKLHFLMDFGANPGTSSLDIADLSSVKALGLRGGISQRLSRDWYVALYCEGGAEVLIPDAGQPAQKTQRYGGCGGRLDGFDAGWLNVTINGDERIGGQVQTTLAVAGALRLYEQKEGQSLAGAHVALVGTAVFGMQGDAVIKIGMVVGGGR